MELQELQNKINSYKKGTFINLEYKSIKKPLAAHKGDVIEKVSSGVYRLGIAYANLSANKDKQTGALPWGEWDPNNENYIIYNSKGEANLRVYIANGFKTISKWFLNGVETTKEYLLNNGYLGKQSSNAIECFTVKVDNIISVGKATV